MRLLATIAFVLVAVSGAEAQYVNDHPGLQPRLMSRPDGYYYQKMPIQPAPVASAPTPRAASRKKTNNGR